MLSYRLEIEDLGEEENRFQRFRAELIEPGEDPVTLAIGRAENAADAASIAVAEGVSNNERS